MPTNAAAAGRAQIDEYLRQMYARAASNLAPVGTLDRMNFPSAPITPLPKFVPGTSSHMPPGGYPQRSPSNEQSTNWKQWLARTNPSYDVKVTPFVPASNAIPNMVLKPNPSTKPYKPNNTVWNLEKARMNADALGDRFLAGKSPSLGLTSYDLDPDLAGMKPYEPTDTSAWQDELMAILGKPDIPGQWISPYSQDYLNQLGQRLVDAGLQGQQGYEGDKGMINDIYAQGIAQRDQRADTLNNELASNASNIGIQFASSGQAQQAAADNAFLDQVSGQNLNTDLSYNTKLGESAAQLGSTLGMQAREGLLTPKQWQGPQSGLSEGDRLRAGFLMDQIGREDTQAYNAIQDQLARDAATKAAKASAASTGSLSDMFKSVLTQGAGDDSLAKYPDLVQALGGIKDPDLKEQALDFWERGEYDPNKTINLIKDAYGPIFDDPTTTGVNEAGEFAPRKVWNSATGDYDIKYDPPSGGFPVSGTGATADKMARDYQAQNSRYAAFIAQKDLEDEWKRILLDLFRGYSPGMGMARTQTTLTNDNKDTYNF